MDKVRKILKKYNSIPIAAKATIWFLFCTILQKSISLLSTPIFTRIMSTEEYGQFSIYNSWLQIFTIITTLRLNWAVFSKGMSKYKEDRDAYTSTMQSLTAVIAIAVFIIYLFFRKQINSLIELPTFIIIAMMGELLVTPAIDFWTIRKRYEYIYKPVVFRTIIMSVLNAVLGVLAVVLADEKGYARILSCVMVNFCFGLILFIYNRIKGKMWIKWEYAKFALLFNLPLLLHYLSVYVLDQFDKIMIQKMVSISAAGIYSVACNLGLIMKIVTQSVNNALVPWQYEKLEKKDFPQMDRIIFLIFCGIGVLTLLFCAFSPEIMKILAGAKYYEAVYAIPPVALSAFFSFMYTTFANVEFFYDQNKFTMYISMAGAALNIVLNYIGIKSFGYIAAAYTTLICYILFAMAHYIYMNYCVKMLFGADQVFDSKRLVVLAMIILLIGLIIILLYNLFILRYIFVIFIIIFMLLKRKIVLEIFNLVKNKG